MNLLYSFAAYSIQFNNPLNHRWGNICLGTWPGQTNCHILRSSFLPKARLMADPASPQVTPPTCPTGKAGTQMLMQLLPDSCGLRGVQSPGSPAPGGRNLMYPHTHHIPQPYLSRRAGLKTQGWRGWAQIHTQAWPLSGQGRGLHVTTSCSALAHPPQESFLRKSWLLHRNGWPQPEDVNRSFVFCSASLQTWGRPLVQEFLGSSAMKKRAEQWREGLEFTSPEYAQWWLS